MLNVGLLGAGRIGKVHAQTISTHPGSRLAAVADVYETAAQDIAERYRSSVQSVDDIISDDGIDAVLIATSTDTHSELIERAIQAGKYVLCEKPVDLSLARARQCRAQVGSGAARVMMGFNRRFDPNFVAMKQAADAGEIGKTELLCVTSFDPAPPPIAYVKVSGGLFRDMMIHDFDIAAFMMGALPQTVSAVGSALVDPAIGEAGDLDTAVATMTYADGRLAVIKNSRRAAYGYDQRVELLGSEGLLQVGNMLENSLVRANKDGVTGAKPEHFFLERYMAAYRAEWAAFVRAIETGAPMPASLDDGIAALAMAEAATQSVRLGSPVKLGDVMQHEGSNDAA